MIAQLIREYGADPVSCIEIHLTPGEREVSCVNETTPGQFLRDWRHAMECKLPDSLSGRWLGIVHESGAYMVKL